MCERFSCVTWSLFAGSFAFCQFLYEALNRSVLHVFHKLFLYLQNNKKTEDTEDHMHVFNTATTYCNREYIIKVYLYVSVVIVLS